MGKKNDSGQYQYQECKDVQLIDDRNLEVNIDKNISFNILSIYNEDKQTEVIIKSLLLYLSYAIFEDVYETDLFGFVTLDPYKFAETMKLGRSNMHRKHPNPAWKIKNPTGEPRFTSYLGNALYILSTHNFIQHYHIRDGNKKITGVKNFIFIEETQEIRKITNKGRNEKIQYKVKLDKRFENNLKEFFLKSNLRHFIEFKSKNIENFYLYIINIYHTYRVNNDMNKFYFKFDEVVKYLKIGIENVPKNRSLIKKKINKYFKDIELQLNNEIPGLKFHWTKSKGESYEFTPYMEWDKSENFLKENNIAFYRTFLKSLRRELYLRYIQLTKESIFDELPFYKWVTVGDYNQVNEIHTNVFDSFYGSTGSTVKDRMNKHFDELRKIRTIDEFRGFFNP